MASCKRCGRHIKLRYYYETGLCHRCYQQINKNEWIDNRLAQKKSPVRDYFGKKFSRTAIVTCISIFIVIAIIYLTSSSDGIVGKWNESQEDFTMTFKKDGSVVMEKSGTVISPIGLQYKIINNNTLSMGNAGTNTLTFNYEIKNGKLVLTGKGVKFELTKISSENIISSMFDSINKLSLSISSHTCPQLPMLLGGQGVMYTIDNKELIEPCPNKIPCVFYGEYHPINSVSKLTDGVWESPSAYIICRNAKYEGENRNYLYCDFGSRFDDHVTSYLHNFISGTDDTIPYIVKKPKEQGEIIEKQELVRKSFMNIYSKEGNFIKTVCGPDPDEIKRQQYEKDKKEFKESMGEFMRELDDWFDI